MYLRPQSVWLRCVVFRCKQEGGRCALHSSSFDSFVDLRYSMLALSGGGPSSLLVIVRAGARPVGALAATVFDLRTDQTTDAIRQAVRKRVAGPSRKSTCRQIAR